MERKERVGAQRIAEGSGGDLKYNSIVFLDRFIEPVEEWIDFSESEEIEARRQAAQMSSGQVPPQFVAVLLFHARRRARRKIIGTARF